MTVAGLVAYPDRAALASTVAPVTGAAARSNRQGHPAGPGRATDLIAQASAPGTGHPAKLLVDEGRRAVREAVELRTEPGGRLLADEPVAWLTVVLAHLPVRDDAWARMDAEYRAAHLRLWTDVVRRATPAYLPGPGVAAGLHRLAVR